MKSRSQEKRGVAPGIRQGNWRRTQAGLRDRPLTPEEFDAWAAMGPVPQVSAANYCARSFELYQRLCAAQLTPAERMELSIATDRVRRGAETRAESFDAAVGRVRARLWPGR